MVHGRRQVISAHRHDWACITIPIVGQGTEHWDGGEARMSGPCVVAHPPGAAHSDHIGEEGLETVSIQYDPRWLSSSSLTFRYPFDRTRWSAGGMVSAHARRLAQTWSRRGVTGPDLARATAAFLHALQSAEPVAVPSWLEHVREAIESPAPPATAALAARLDLHPAWLARAYRAAVGEGLAETARRKRVERALPLLHRTRLPLSQVAAAAGYADQSHMNRDFRILLGRTPLQVRTESARLELSGRSWSERH